MQNQSLDSFNCRKVLNVNGKEYVYFSLKEAEKNGLSGISKLPYSMKVVLENLLRFEDGSTVDKQDMIAIANWLKTRTSNHEIAFRPSRVLMQDFTGVPAVVDLAAMRDATKNLGADPEKINPLVPVDLVIDHSVMVDKFGTPSAFKQNVELEYQRNSERYEFLRWGQEAFDNFSVVPPGTGICHQVNLEYLAQTVWTNEIDGKIIAYPDSLVGTDSHTTMVNALSVLGWGVGGIEAEAAMLGQPITMLIPEVIGFKIVGKAREGITATDIVLTIVEMLRKKGVVGKFVEFYGEGLDNLTLEDCATIANMAPEYGATCGFFPIDEDTINYLKITGRDEDRIELVKAYAQEQGLFRDANSQDPVFTDIIELDLSTVVPSISGPKRPQDRVALSEAKTKFEDILVSEFNKDEKIVAKVEGKDYTLSHGDVVIAAITSCTNTSNPSVMIGAGLLARKAREKGLKVKPWVKTSLAPGSQIVSEYLAAAGLQKDLDAMGFDLVGYGCTTCIGNSGPLPEEISKTIKEHDLVATSVLSGNRNFEGRISPDVKANYLASPPLVVAYAIAGSLLIDLDKEPLGNDKEGNPVYLRDIWPSNEEISQAVRSSITREMFKKRYKDVFKGDEHWQNIEISATQTYNWNASSTYVKNPPYFEGFTIEPKPLKDINNARILGLFGDSITTDHISPAGAFKKDSPAGKYLIERQVQPKDFNSYGSRRGNHEVMMRGTFANIRIKNQMVKNVEGGFTIGPDGSLMPIYDAAMQYKQQNIDLIVMAGKEYGTGSSRDWAAKGTRLLGVRAVIAQSFERIHRSNLIGMGVLPLQFIDEQGWQELGIKGDEQISIGHIDEIEPRAMVDVKITFADGEEKTIKTLCRIDTENELIYYKNGGILHYVLRNLVAE